MTTEMMPALDFILDYEAVKPRLFIKTLNVENNRNILITSPHDRIYEDIAFVPYILVSKDKTGFKCARVTNDMLSAWKAADSTVIEDAWTNTPVLFPAKVNGLNNIVETLLVKKEIDNDESFLPLGPTVIMNNDGYYGASVLFYPKVKEAIGKRIGNYFALPSSVHEWIILSDNGDYNPEQLAEMVRGINATEVAPVDRLSDHVYYYDGNNFTIVA